MVAVMHFAKGFHRVLNYNEHKVTEGVARLLDAAHYPKSSDNLSFTQKLKRLENLAALNQRTTVNCVHISLNFDPAEKLNDELLLEISAVYMDKIGFAGQPFLLYRHEDSGHPHVHIVTTNIQADGRRISLHNLGKVQSENARKEIDLQYGLLRPEDSASRNIYKLQPVNVQKAQYGKTATKRAITTVVNKIINEYKYTSLPELNAILKLYNIAADRGTEHSRIYKNQGLTYSMIKEDGSKVGVPIKASDLYGKPTLKSLEERFILNGPLREKYKGKLKSTIDWILLKEDKRLLEQLINKLQKDGISLVLRQNDKGIIYGITYVDHRTKCVFNGSDLGKAYSAKAILEKCNAGSSISHSTGAGKAELQGQPTLEPAINFAVAETLLQQEYTGEVLPFELRKKKKKRKRISDNH